MRIASISTVARGGAAIAGARIARALTDAGHECSFITLTSSQNSTFTHLPLIDAKSGETRWQELWSRWMSLGIREGLPRGAELFSDTIPGWDDETSVPEAIFNADIIHLHWVAGLLFSPALLRAFQGKKIVWTLHDMNAFTGGCHYHPLCRKFETSCEECSMLLSPGKNDASAHGFLLRKDLYPHLAPTIVTPSAWLASEAQTSALLGRYETITIPNPCDTEIFKPGNRAEIRGSLGLSADALVLLVGADFLSSSRKNIMSAFDALNILAQRNKKMRIEVLAFGDGDPIPSPFPVTWAGHVSNESALANIYSAADLYVHTALLDNLPNTLCEAQCCGTPAICYNSGGSSETMLPGKTGFVVTQTTSSALADALEYVYNTRTSLPAMRTAARAFAVERFSPQKTAEAYAKVYDRAFQAPGFAEAPGFFLLLTRNSVPALVGEHPVVPKMPALNAMENRIVTLYETILHRTPTLPEVAAWMAEIAGGKSFTEIFDSFLSCEERQNMMRATTTPYAESGKPSDIAAHRKKEA